MKPQIFLFVDQTNGCTDFYKSLIFTNHDQAKDADTFIRKNRIFLMESRLTCNKSWHNNATHLFLFFNLTLYSKKLLYLDTVVTLQVSRISYITILPVGCRV